MRILFFSYSYWPPDFGGELLVALERFRSLVTDYGVEVVAFTAGKPGFPPSEWRDGIQIFRTPALHASRWGRAARRLLFAFLGIWVILFWQYDVVHFGSLPGLGGSGDAFLGWLYAVLARLRGKRSVWVHSLADDENQTVRFNGFEGLMKRAFFSQVSHLVAVSPALADGLKSFFCRVVLLPYGIRDDLFTPLSSEERLLFRNNYQIREEDVVFTFLGSIGRRKGFDVLAQAFSELARTHLHWHLWVVGPRTCTENQNLDEQEVAEVTAPLAGLDGQVHYWGRINDRSALAKILGVSDVFVFPSRREGMGVAPLEAMSCGVPVILSRLPGITDLANIEGKTGVYIPAGDVEALKRAMILLGENVWLRKEMGAQASQRIRESFGWKTYIRQWFNVYRGEFPVHE